MGQSTYFGRPEQGERHLGADFDLLAKWSRTFALRAPVHSYYLSQLSQDDLDLLLSGPAQQEFRLRAQPDGSVKLEKVEDGGGGAELPSGGIRLRSMDPAVLDMMRSENYIRSEARTYQLLSEIEDAQDGSQKVAQSVYLKALRQGIDHRRAESLGKEAADRHLVSVGRQVRASWKAERLERFLANVNAAGPVSHRPASIVPEDPQSSEVASKAEPPKVFDSRFAEVKDNQTTTPQSKPCLKLASSPVCTPDNGSDTTAESSHWSSSSRYSTDDSWSPELESVSGVFDADGGVALLPSSLAEELELREHGNLDTHTAASHSTGAHLGAGLGQPFLITTSFVAKHGAPAANTAAAVCRAPALAPPTVPLAAQRISAQSSNDPFVASDGKDGSVDGTPLPFTFQQPKRATYPLAKEQPWMGFTCYDVSYKCGSNHLAPKYWTTRQGKERYIRHKLSGLKLEDAKLASDRVLGPVARNPIHIFVDLSNIIIGFYNCMKESRDIPMHKRVIAPPFSFRNFDTILTRDRNVAKRIVAGSLANSAHKRRPEYMLQAEELKYEMNILTRVPKPASPARKRKPKSGSRELDSAGSGHDASGDDCSMGPTKYGEQGVDEILHLKMLQSAVDTRNPGTMVVATGDGAHAEYSDGFKVNIERALTCGWIVELYGWRRNFSAAWRDPKFAERWGQRFKMIELDPFCEELFDMTMENLQVRSKQ